jgi:ribonuclease HIII
VSQRTLVLRLDPAEGAALENSVREAGLELREVPHARFSARGDGHVATLYTSGKLVVQGADPELFVGRHLDREVDAPAQGEPGRSEPDALELLEAGPLIGSDEAGKGDFLGPLTVAAVRLDEGDAERLRGGGVGDSKRLSDHRVHELAEGLRAHFPHAVRVLEPREYNGLYAHHGNLNELLADLHAEVVRELATPGVPVLVDRFANESLLAERLEGLELHQAPRAERATAVAAASVLARNAFLEGLEAPSDRFGVALAKGAGPPVDAAARALVAAHGEEALGEVAKLHFANASRVGGAR